MTFDQWFNAGCLADTETPNDRLRGLCAEAFAAGARSMVTEPMPSEAEIVERVLERIRQSKEVRSALVQLMLKELP